MWNAIWEFFFCPQHGIIVQCWFMLPVVFAALLAYGRQAWNYVRAYVRARVSTSSKVK
jgi:hypothetical protein